MSHWVVCMSNPNKIMRLRFFQIAGLVAALAMPSGVAESQESTTDLNPGDQIRIMVWRKPEMSGDFTIGGNGTILHPLYREVAVVGIPLSVVEDRLRTFLTRYETNPQFVISPLVRIIVGGEVRSPNILAVPPETSVAQAVALAGGPTDRGRLDRVKIIREGQEISVDLSRPDSDVGLLRIRSGDQIIVSRRGPGAREYLWPITSMVAAAASIVGIFAK